MFSIHLCFLLSIIPSIILPVCALNGINEASNEDEIVLKYRNNGTIDDRIVSLRPDSVIKIRAVDLPPKNAYFGIVQAHSQIYPINLAHSRELEKGNNVNGTSIGILVEMKDVRGGVMAHLCNHQPFNVTVLVFILFYDRSVPEPGGCNLEFEMEVSPWLRLSYNQNLVSVEHELASLPPSRGTAFGCETESLEYEIFHYYLTQRDFSQESFFEAIRLLRTVTGVQEHGREIRSFGFTPSTRSLFGQYPGVGRVFAVTVTYVGVSGSYPVAAYVPSVTYGCDLTVEGDCQPLRSIYGKILCALSIFIGLLLTFAGHRWFHLEMFLGGFAAFSAVSYILLINHLETNVTGMAAGISVMGLLGGLLWWFVWWYWGIPALSVLPVVLLLGFLVASSLFYLPISFEFLINDFNFWSAFSCCWLVLPVVFIAFTRIGNIISCAVLGGYAVILPIDYYIGSSLKYIIVNVVRRITVRGFGRAVVDPPFQDNELILTLSWGALAISGVAFQYLRELKRPPFSPPGDLWRPWSWRQDRTNASVTEQAPLIPDATSTPGSLYGSSA